MLIYCNFISKSVKVDDNSPILNGITFLITPNIQSTQQGRSLTIIFIIFSNTLSPEPVGSKAPTFSSEYKSFTVVRHLADDMALLCQAQAFPVPRFRCFIILIYC